MLYVEASKCMILQVDPFPKTVCYKCISTLDIVYEFWKNVKNADKTIRRSYTTSADNKITYKQSNQVRKRGSSESTNQKAVKILAKSNISTTSKTRCHKFSNTDQSSSEESTVDKPMSNGFTQEIKRNRPITAHQEKKMKVTKQLNNKNKPILRQQPRSIDRKAIHHQNNCMLMPIQAKKKQKDTAQKIYGVNKGKNPVDEDITDSTSEPNVVEESQENLTSSSAPSYESLLRQLPSFGEIVSSEAGLIASDNDEEIRPRLESHNLWHRQTSPSQKWLNRSNSSQETGSSSSNPKIIAPKTIQSKSHRQVTNYKSNSRTYGSRSLSKPRRKLDTNIRNKTTKNDAHTQKQRVVDPVSIPSDSDCSFATTLQSMGMFLNKNEITSSRPIMERQPISTDNEAGIVKISDFWKHSYNGAVQNISPKETDVLHATKNTDFNKDLIDYKAQEDPFDTLLKSTKSAPSNKIQSSHYTTKEFTFDFSSQGSDLHLTPNVTVIQRIRERMPSKKKR